MEIPAFATLTEALALLAAESGKNWSRSNFFESVVGHALPLRSATPDTARPILHAGEGEVDANLPYVGRRLAVLLTPQSKDLWLHGEVNTRLVGLEPGDPGYLAWSAIKARRVTLDRAAHSPQSWNSEWPDSDWHDGELMGECSVSRFSEAVCVTDDTCLVPRETIHELLTIFAAQEQARKVLTISGVPEGTKPTALDEAPSKNATSGLQLPNAQPTVIDATRPDPRVDTAGMSNADDALAALFDPVTAASLEKMFSASGRWNGWVERAGRNGLKSAREGRAQFNPYRAGIWFLQQGEPNWDLARCNRVLANNLPARSQSEGYRLTGELR